MSANNHDKDDPNNVKYVREPKKEIDFDLKGKIIKIYTIAQTKTLKEFMKWYEDNQP